MDRFGFLASVIISMVTTAVCMLSGGNLLVEQETAATYTEAEIDLMARTVYAEAGNQDEIGQRLIVSVILNRLESDMQDFADQDTVAKVINAPSQFVTADWAPAESYDAVYKEIADRTNNSVLWFYSTGYPPYGEQLFQHGAHYFAGYTK